MQLHLKHTQAERQTDRRQESNLVHFSLKMWHVIINWPNLVPLLVDPGFLSPVKFPCTSFRYRMDAPDRHNGQTEKRTIGKTDVSLCPFRLKNYPSAGCWLQYGHDVVVNTRVASARCWLLNRKPSRSTQRDYMRAVARGRLLRQVEQHHSSPAVHWKFWLLCLPAAESNALRYGILRRECSSYTETFRYPSRLIFTT